MSEQETRLLKASVRYYDCLCEFDGLDDDCCGEYAEQWDDAVEAYKVSAVSPAPAGELRERIANIISEEAHGLGLIVLNPHWQEKVYKAADAVIRVLNGAGER